MNLALVTYIHYQPKPGPFSYFDISNKRYFSVEEQKLDIRSFMKSDVASLLSILEADPKHKVNLAISIPILKYLQEDMPMLKQFRKLLESGQLELIGGGGYDSFSILYARTLFQKELQLQLDLLLNLFDIKPHGFLNSGLLYSDDVGQVIDDMGFQYAIVPTISWFIKDKSQSQFKAKKGDIDLFRISSEERNHDLYPARVTLSETAINDYEKETDECFLLSDLLGKNELSEYGLPELVAYDDQVGGFDMIFSNNLQKDFFSRIASLNKAVASSKDEDILDDYLWIGSKAHFKALSTKSPDRHKLYAKLLTMLYDLEIRLR